MGRPPKKGKVTRDPEVSALGQDLLDPTDLLTAAIAQGLEAGSADLDDRDVLRAPNVVEWLTGAKFLDLKPFPKQLEDAIHMFTAACIAEGEKIPAIAGPVPIEDLEIGTQVWTKDGWHPVKEKKLTGHKDVYTLSTNLGFTTNGSLDHRFYVLREDLKTVWRPMSKIRPGDHVAISVPEFSETRDGILPRIREMSKAKGRPETVVSTPSSLSVELSRLLAYLWTDGHVGTYSTSFTNTRRSLVDDYVKCWKATFPNTNLAVSQYGNKWEVVYSGSYLSRWFRKLGRTRLKKDLKGLPPAVWAGGRDHMASFLQCFFEGDGGARGKLLMACSPSNDVAQELQLALLGFGILGRRKEGKGVYEVVLEGTNAKQFRKTIGFFSDKIDYQHRLASDSPPSNGGSNGVSLRLRIPHVKEALTTLMPDKPYHLSFGGLNRHNPTYHKLDNIAGWIYDNINQVDPKLGKRLKTLHQKRLVWLPVKSIKLHKKNHPVWDIETNGSFSAGGHVVHNCYFCSDSGYLQDIPVDEQIGNILDRCTLMEFGKCPSCGRTAAEMRKEWVLSADDPGIIKPAIPNDLVGLEGQRCLVGGTLVLTKTRGLIPLKKVRVGDLVWSPDGWKYVLRRYRFRDKSTRKLTFDDGSTLRGGFQHRVKVITPTGELRFKRFADLREGEWVAHFAGTESRTGEDSLPSCSYRKGPQSGNVQDVDTPSQMSHALARMLGHLVAEGTVTSKYTIKFTNTDEQMHQDYIAACSDVFGIVPARYPPDFVDSEFCSRRARHWLEQLGLGRLRAERKKLPWVILRASPAFQWSFLAALYEGDGSASGERLRYHTTSKKLAHQLLTLLRSLGFDPSLTIGETKPGSGSNKGFKPRPLYEVRIAKVLDIERFTRCVPWITDRKGSSARALGEKHENGYFFHLYPHCHDLTVPLHEQATTRVPHQIHVKSEKKGSHTRVVYRCAAPKAVRDVTGGQLRGADTFLSSVGLRTLADHFGVDKLPSTLQEIIKNDLRFKQVVRIRDGKQEDLYDLTVDGHVYWTKGVLSHNSGKSTKTAMYSTWVLHRFLMLPNPTKFFGLLESVGALHSTFVSVTANQARENLWQPFSDLVDSAPWFKEYHKWLQGRGQELGIELVHKPDTFLWYGHKRLALSYAPSDQRTLRGRTRFMCVSPDTLVSTPQGLVPIGSTCSEVGAHPAPTGLRTVSHEGPAVVELVIRHEMVPTLRVETDHGLELYGTHTHRVLVLDHAANFDWKQLDALEPGDRLTLTSDACWPKAPPEWEWTPSSRTSNRTKHLDLPTSMSLPLARLLGYHASKGSLAHGKNGNHKMSFSNTVEDVSDDYSGCFQRAFGFPASVEYAPKGAISRATKDAWRVYVYSSVLCAWMEFIGAGGNSETKEVPWVILRSPKTYVIEFLRGLFEGDGHVDDSMVRLDTKSEALARQVQILLGHLGVVSTRARRYRLEYDAYYWTVGIYGENRNRFVEQVGFTTKEAKVQPVRNTYESEFTPDLQRVRSCKLACSGVNAKLYQCTDGKVRSFPGLAVYFRKVTPWKLRRNPERLRQLEKVDPELAARLRRVSECQTSPVRSIQPGPDSQVCDWSVADVHNYATNTIISHNSAVDELGWYGASKDRTGTSRVKADGDGTVRALARSLSTIRNAAKKRRSKVPDCPDAYLFTISSPSAATDPIMRRYNAAAKKPRLLAVKRATWEANPEYTMEGLREEEGEVTDRDFMCDFGCVPPYSDDPWWDNQETLIDLCSKRSTNLWVGSPTLNKDPIGRSSRYVAYKFASINRDKATPRCLSFDTGERACSFSWAVTSFDRENDTVVVEDVGELAPAKGEHIHHGLMWEHVIVPLVTGFHCVHVVWDRWESTRYVQDLRTIHQVRAEQYSATMRDGKNLRSDMLNGRVTLPQPETKIEDLEIGSNVDLARYPKTHLLFQFLAARDHNGLPLKPDGGNDDTLRAVLLGHRFVRDNPDMYFARAGRNPNNVIGIGPGARPIRGANAGTNPRLQNVIVGTSGSAIGVGPRR